jgi:signal transduction histidine kinase
MVHHGIVLGTLEASPRSAGEPFGERDLRLLGDVATQAAVAAQSLRLTDALARSRARAVTAAEDERQRIRRDLHDGLGPALTAISLQLSAALDHAPPGDVVSSIEQATRAATTAKAEVRRIIEGMTPAQLDRLGVMAAVRALGDQLNADPAAGTPGHPMVSVDGPATLDAVAPEVEVSAYRIAAEAMLNAHRHSGGCCCKVVANVVAGELRLQVDDDGVGLARDEHRSDGVGLASMRARVDALGGRIEIGPGRNGGTSVAVILPAHGRGEDDD